MNKNCQRCGEKAALTPNGDVPMVRLELRDESRTVTRKLRLTLGSLTGCAVPSPTMQAHVEFALCGSCSKDVWEYACQKRTDSGTELAFDDGAPKSANRNAGVNLNAGVDISAYLAESGLHFIEPKETPVGNRPAKFLNGFDLGATIAAISSDGWEFAGILDRFEHYDGGVELHILKPGHYGPTFVTPDTPIQFFERATK